LVSLLVTLLAVIGPYSGFVPASLEYPFNVFYALVVMIVVSTWPLLFLSDRVQGTSLVVLLQSSVFANMIAVVLIEGSALSIYMGLITFSCLRSGRRIVSSSLTKARGASRAVMSN
jgi:hypothetical protein